MLKEYTLFCRFLFCCVLISCLYSSHAKGADTTPEGEKLLLLAKNQFLRQAIDSSYLNYTKAETIFKAQPNSQDKYMEARQGVEKVMLTMHSLNNVRQYLNEDRQFLKKHFNPESEVYRNFYLTLAELQFEEKDVDNIMNTLQKGRRISEKLYGKKDMKTALVYATISKNYLFFGMADSANLYSQKALKILHQNPEPWKEEYASGFYNVAGYGYRMKHYDPREAGKPAIAGGKKYPTNLHIYLKYLDSALVVESYHYGKDGGQSGKIYFNIATSYLDLYREGQQLPLAQRKELLLKSVDYLNRSIEILQKIKNPEVGIAYSMLGSVYTSPELYNSEKAAENYWLALKTSLPAYKGKSLYDVPEIRNVQSINYLAHILSSISQYFDTESQKAPGNLKLMEMRYQYSLKGIDLAQYMDQRVRFFEKDNSNNSFGVNYRQYGQGIADAYELYQKTGQEKYKAEAFRIAEKFKSYNLLQASLQARIDQILDNRKQVSEDYKQLVNKVVRYEEQVTVADRYPLLAKNEPFKTAKTNLAKAEDALQNFIEKAKEGAPKFYQEKVEQNYALSLQQAKAQTDPNSAAISYFLNEGFYEQPQVFVFVIRPDKTEFLKIDLPENYEGQVGTLVKSITGSENENYRKLGSQFYNLLLEPALATVGPEVKKLVIMPDGYLWQIPFEALLTQPTTASDYRKMPYLFRKYQVSYQHSATLGKIFKDQAAEQEGTHSKTVLALAPFADKKLAAEIANGKVNLMGGELSKGAYSKLPYTIKLLQELEKKVKGLFLIDTDASEENFKKHAGKYSIIHLATHAETDLYDPFQSKFLLAKGKNEDGDLHMSELLNMDIKPSLAVLSACETGVGKVDATTEGMTSLGWCFNYLGCPSTVSTLWKVDDRQTSILLKGFYTYLIGGKTKNESLQQAKLDFIHKARTSDEANPFYWSGMVLIGDDGILNLATRPWWERWQFWVVAGVSILLIIGLFLFRKNRKAKNQLQTKAPQNVVLNR